MKEQNKIPVLILNRLSKQEIDHYTSIKDSDENLKLQSELSFKSRQLPVRQKKQEANQNLKDVSRVDFTLFEEYRRKRAKFLKKKDGKEKTKAKNSDNASKSSKLPKNVLSDCNEIHHPNISKNKLLSDANNSQSVSLHKQKNSTNAKGLKRNRTLSSERGILNNRSKPFKRVSIESDSDESVENFGIVFSQTKDRPVFPRQISGQPNYALYSSYNYGAQYSSNLQQMQNNQNNFQMKALNKKNYSSSHPEVIIDEHDILSALTFDQSDDILQKEITNKFPEIDLKSLKLHSDEDFINLISKNSKKSKTNEPHPQNTDSSERMQYANDKKAPKITNSAPKSSYLKNTDSVTNMKTSCEKPSDLKEYDIVQKIMQEMDGSNPKVKKVDASNHSSHGVTNNSPLVIRVQKDLTSKEGTPSYFINRITNQNDSSSVKPVKQNEQNDPADLTNKASNIGDSSPIHNVSNNSNIVFGSHLNESNAESELSKTQVQTNGLRTPPPENSSTIELCLKEDEQKALKLNEIKTCLRCKSEFLQGEKNRTICSPCKSSLTQNRSLISDPIKLPLQIKSRTSPLKSRISPLKSRISPLKKFQKWKANGVHKKAYNAQDRIKKVLKKLSKYDQRMLSYKNPNINNKNYHHNLVQENSSALIPSSEKDHKDNKQLEYEKPNDNNKNSARKKDGDSNVSHTINNKVSKLQKNTRKLRQLLPKLHSKSTSEIISNKNISDVTNNKPSKLPGNSVKQNQALLQSHVESISDEVTESSTIGAEENHSELKDKKTDDSNEPEQKSGCKIKNINRGLFLMTFPERDEEIDLSYDKESEKMEKAMQSKDKEVVEKKDEIPNKAKEVVEKKDKIRNKAKEVVGKKDEISLQSNNLNIVPAKENSGPPPLYATFIIPQLPSIILTTVTTTDFKQPSYQLTPDINCQNSAILLPNKIDFVSPVNNVKSISTSEETRVNKDTSSINNNILSNVENSSDKDIHLNAASVLEKTIDNPPNVVPNLENSGGKDIPPHSETGSSLQNSTVGAISPNPDAECENKSENESPRTNSKLKHNPLDTVVQTNRVFHELDAIAILSILDLDGNKKHSEKLLLSLLYKEYQELKKLCEFDLASMDEVWKKFILHKKQQKVDKIKSLQFASALFKKYGQLSNIVSVLLQKAQPNVADKQKENLKDKNTHEYQDSTTKKSDQDLISTKSNEELTATKSYQELTATKSYQELTATKSYQELTATKSYQELTATKSYQELTATKSYQELTATKSYQELTATKNNEDLTAAKINQDMTTPKRNQEFTVTKNNQDLCTTKSNQDLITTKINQVITTTSSNQEFTITKSNQNFTITKSNQDLTAMKSYLEKPMEENIKKLKERSDCQFSANPPPAADLFPKQIQNEVAVPNNVSLLNQVVENTESANAALNRIVNLKELSIEKSKRTTESDPLDRLRQINPEISITPRVKKENLSSCCMQNKTSTAVPETQNNYINKLTQQVSSLASHQTNAIYAASLQTPLTYSTQANGIQANRFNPPSMPAPSPLQASSPGSAARLDDTESRFRGTPSSVGNARTSSMGQSHSTDERSFLPVSPANIKQEVTDSPGQCTAQRQLGPVTGSPHSMGHNVSCDPLVPVKANVMPHAQNMMQHNNMVAQRNMSYQAPTLTNVLDRKGPPNRIMAQHGGPILSNLLNFSGGSFSSHMGQNVNQALSNVNKPMSDYAAQQNQHHLVNNSVRVQQVVIPTTVGNYPQASKSYVPGHMNHVMPPAYNANHCLRPPVVPRIQQGNPVAMNQQSHQVPNSFTIHHGVQGVAVANYQAVSSAPQGVPRAPLPVWNKAPAQVSGSVVNSSLLYCAVCKKVAALRCKQCSKVAYCSTSCAQRYWNMGHKEQCKKLVS